MWLWQNPQQHVTMLQFWPNCYRRYIEYKFNFTLTFKQSCKAMINYFYLIFVISPWSHFTHCHEMFIFLDWINSSLIDQLAGRAVALYCLQVKSPKVIHSASHRNPRKKQTSMFDLCRDSGNRLLLQLISASTEYKKRLSNSNQIDNLRRDLAQVGEHYADKADPDYIYTMI